MENYDLRMKGGRRGGLSKRREVELNTVKASQHQTRSNTVNEAIRGRRGEIDLDYCCSDSEEAEVESCFPAADIGSFRLLYHLVRQQFEEAWRGIRAG